MSFGTDPGAAAQPGRARRRRLRLRAQRRHGGRRRRQPDRPSRATRPTSCSRPAPAPTSPPARACRSPRPTPSDARASFAGHGSQISLAAYGAYDSSPAAQRAARDLRRLHGRAQRARDRVARAAAAPAVRLPHDLRRRRALRLRAGHLDGDADGRGRRRAGPPPQPRPHRVAEIVRLIKETARRPAGVWTADAGLGDPRRGRRADPRGEHRPPRADLAGQARCRRARPSATITVRWTAADPAPAGVRASGIARYELWRATDGGSLQAPALDHAHVAPGHAAPRRALSLLHASRSTTRATASRRPSRPTRAIARRR